MKITAIKQQLKNPERVSIFIDGKYSVSLTLDQLLQEKLKKEQDIDEGDLKRLKKLSDEGKVRARTLEWLMRRPHSERELRDYLYRKKAEKDFADMLVNEFIDKKYLDDGAFARWFAENRIRKNRSKQAIAAELISKGISSVTIQSVVTELSLDVSEEQSLKQLVNKLRNKPRYSDEAKLIRYLLSKGFRYGDIKNVLRAEVDAF
jgi:regulatory protein